MSKVPSLLGGSNDGIPAFLKRETNAKGVTLSAGPVTATAAKVTKVPTGMTAKKLAAQEAKAAKVAAPKPEKPVKAAKAPKSTPVTAEPALGSDGQPLEKVSRSIVPMKFKARYAKNAGTCGDDMALELKAATTTRNADKREVLDTEALWAIAKANGLDVAKYVDLNNGQKRMNVGNKLRGLLAAGTDVVVGTRQFKAEDFMPKH
jgi:hypothetical protein